MKDQTIYLAGGQTGVLLIHGLGGTPVEMRTLAKRLNAAGHTVLCCQLPGHCGTEADLLKTGWRDWLAGVEEALGELEKTCTQIVTGGLSMGAILASLVAARHPTRVHGVAMLAPTLTYDGWSMPWYRFLLRLLIHTPMGRRYKFVEHFPYGIKDERIRAMIMRSLNSGDSAEAGLMSTPSASVRQFWLMVDVYRKEMRTVKQRTLIIHPREDDMASLWNVERLQRGLGGLVDTLILDDSYHIITVDRQRHLVADRTVEFLQEVFRAREVKPIKRAMTSQHAA
ncbi:alpha/beta hydrolase [Methylovirgula sp. 4M-Z18]|uniref:alpha/beta hydrolase n=1 Tax=Methylovirgula sp. 4M-Z18 TaxID=2293567 RepID=UPI000E2E9131|nr:alpha/beta fold hydrolase [Methylovirgula sp. 4M-Z18]RFB75556.1 alpha/beta fold hydrolase [Methylovirgula sp. 4M-Z18]